MRLSLSSRRRGYTLIEMLMTIVLLGIIGTSLTKLLIFQTRNFDRDNAIRGARAVSRGAPAAMLSDLRMTQDTLGLDSLTTDGKLIRMKVPYRFGLVCLTSAASTTVSMLPVDSAMNAFAVYGGYAVRNATTGRYNYTATTVVPIVGVSATCTGSAAGQPNIRTISVHNRSGDVLTVSPGDAGATVGTPVFFWQQITYYFGASATFPGRLGLYRRVGGGAAEELMAPFNSASRFRFYFVADDTSRTSIDYSDLPRVKGVDVVLNGQSQQRPFGSTTYKTANVTTAVFFRNIRR